VWCLCCILLYTSFLTAVTCLHSASNQLLHYTLSTFYYDVLESFPSSTDTLTVSKTCQAFIKSFNISGFSFWFFSLPLLIFLPWEPHIF
jgi:hypothetical protein